MASEKVDAQFHRAVDIVQSLPKGGPVQTSYEEKLWLYSLYKQGTEGDLSVSRPGMLDLLGRAKWDSWNKQRGVGKTEAKRLYVAALIKILRRFTDRASTQTFIDELESYEPASMSEHRPVSPASSSSSYHSSQASPPPEPHSNLYPPPDPTLPAPDVAPDIVPPSALSSSHRSLLNLSHSVQGTSPSGILGVSNPHQGANSLPNASRPQSVTGGWGGGEPSIGGYFSNNASNRNNSIHSFKRNTPILSRPGVAGPSTSSALGLVAEQNYPRPESRSYTPEPPVTRDFGIPGLAPSVGGGVYTPDMNLLPSSPYLGIIQPTSTYPLRGPASTSTFSAAPAPVPISHTLQQIQTSLTALHERLSTLERTQAAFLRREERKKNGWSSFWTSKEEKELEELEDEDVKWPRTDIAVGENVGRRVVKRKKGVGVRVVWILLSAIRRATVDFGVGMLVVMVGLMVFNRGWRRRRGEIRALAGRVKKMISGE